MPFRPVTDKLVNDHLMTWDNLAREWQNKDHHVPRAQWLQNGFPDASEVSLAWDDASRTLTVSPVGPNFRYLHDGIQYKETGSLTETNTDTDGLWII